MGLGNADERGRFRLGQTLAEMAYADAGIDSTGTAATLNRANVRAKNSRLGSHHEDRANAAADADGVKAGGETVAFSVELVGGPVDVAKAADGVGAGWTDDGELRRPSPGEVGEVGGDVEARGFEHDRARQFTRTDGRCGAPEVFQDATVEDVAADDALHSFFDAEVLTGNGQDAGKQGLIHAGDVCHADIVLEGLVRFTRSCGGRPQKDAVQGRQIEILKCAGEGRSERPRCPVEGGGLLSPASQLVAATPH